MILCAMSLAFSAFAQDASSSREQQREQIQAMKIAYITEKVGLTPAESERFWPVYNEYWKERRNLAHSKRDLFKKIEQSAVTKTALDEMFELQTAETALLRRYSERFLTILSDDKTAKVFVSEESFKGVLLRRVHK